MGDLHLGDEPAAVVRAWLEAPRGHVADFLIGPVRDHQLLVDGIAANVTVTRRAPVVRTLGVREQTDTSAICDLDATLVLDARTRDGESMSFTRTVSGPVVLCRDADAWKVADYVYEGRRALESERLYAAAARIELPGLTVAPLALDLRGTGTGFVFELENGGAEELVVLSLSLPRSANLMGPVPWTYLNGPTRLAPGETVRIEAQSAFAVPLTTRELTVSMYVRPAAAGGRARLVRLTVPFAGEPRAPRATAKTLRGLSPRVAWAINLTMLVGIVVLLGFPDWLGGGESYTEPNSRDGVVLTYLAAAQDGDDTTIRLLATEGNQGSLLDAASTIQRADVALDAAEWRGTESTTVVTFPAAPDPDGASCPLDVLLQPVEVRGRWLLSAVTAQTDESCA